MSKGIANHFKSSTSETMHDKSIHKFDKHDNPTIKRQESKRINFS